MPYIKIKIGELSQTIKRLTKNPQNHYGDMKEPKGRGDGALSQQSVPVGHQGLLPSSELTIQGVLRMLMVRGLLARAHVCVEETERRRRW